MTPKQTEHDLEAEIEDLREDAHEWQEENARLREALRELADTAAIAVCSPRRFHENEGNRQQRLGQAIAKARNINA